MKISIKIFLFSVFFLAAVTLNFAVIPVCTDASSVKNEPLDLSEIYSMDMEEYDKYLDSLSEEELMQFEQQLAEARDKGLYNLDEACSYDAEYYQQYRESLSEEELLEMEEKIAATKEMEARIENELQEQSNVELTDFDFWNYFSD